MGNKLTFLSKSSCPKVVEKERKTYNVIDEINNKIFFVNKDTVVMALKHKRCSTYLSRWNSAYASSKAVTKQLRRLFSMNMTCTWGSIQAFKHIPMSQLF